MPFAKTVRHGGLRRRGGIANRKSAGNVKEA
jgi:hypothetical protein